MGFELALRIDVDTYRGTKLGVVPLSRLLRERGIRASFFFSLGPDNMGRNVFRLFRPSFFMKMLRSNAASLYGWDILFRGFLWPGALIGVNLAEQISSVAEDGHELCLHAWDHYKWQNYAYSMSQEEVCEQLHLAFEALKSITGGRPIASASPAWACSDEVLLAKERFAFDYNSDCRGRSIFYPRVRGRVLGIPQIPTTLATYDEVIGQNGIDDANYNRYILSLLREDQLNVYTLHAEVEGISRFELFCDFISQGLEKGVEFFPLGSLLERFSDREVCDVELRECPGRDGELAYQV